MSAFEFVFGLVGLLLGLSFAEVLGGLVRALKVGAVLLWWSRKGRVDVAVLFVLIANGVWTFAY